jgi:hypothetical protein
MPRISHAQLYDHPQVNVISTQPTDALLCGFYKVISEAGCYGGFYCVSLNWFGAKCITDWAGCGASVDDNGALVA